MRDSEESYLRWLWRRRKYHILAITGWAFWVVAITAYVTVQLIEAWS